MWVKCIDLGLQFGGQYVIDGVMFQEIECGYVGYIIEGMMGLLVGGEMDYVDCVSVGQGVDEFMLLLFECWVLDMGWEIVIGKFVLVGEFIVYFVFLVLVQG